MFVLLNILFPPIDILNRLVFSRPKVSIESIRAGDRMPGIVWKTWHFRVLVLSGASGFLAETPWLSWEFLIVEVGSVVYKEFWE